jgi:hypothetical protein
MTHAQEEKQRKQTKRQDATRKPGGVGFAQQQQGTTNDNKKTSVPFACVLNILLGEQYT